MRELEERIRDHGAVACLTGDPAPGTAVSRARRAARERLRAADDPGGAPRAGSSAAARAAHRWAAHGARERALTESVARHPAARSRRAPGPGAPGSGAPVSGPAGAPNAAVRAPRCTAAVPAPGTTATLTRPAPATAPPGRWSVAAPPPRTVRPSGRHCLVPARPRPARSRARGRLERLLTGVAVLLCATTAVVALGLLGDAAAGWNAPAGAVPSVGVVR